MRIIRDGPSALAYESAQSGAIAGNGNQVSLLHGGQLENLLVFNQQRPAFAKMRVVPIRTVLLLSRAEHEERELRNLKRKLADRVRKRRNQRLSRERTNARNRASYYRNRTKVLAANRAYRERIGREEMKLRYAKYRANAKQQ